MCDSFYKYFQKNIAAGKKQLAILIDPDKFDISETELFLHKIPNDTTHLFVGGSIVENGQTEITVKIAHVKPLLTYKGFPPFEAIFV